LKAVLISRVNDVYVNSLRVSNEGKEKNSLQMLLGNANRYHMLSDRA
jgi:hypothetical protein